MTGGRIRWGFIPMLRNKKTAYPKKKGSYKGYLAQRASFGHNQCADKNGELLRNRMAQRALFCGKNQQLHTLFEFLVAVKFISNKTNHC